MFLIWAFLRQTFCTLVCLSNFYSAFEKQFGLMGNSRVKITFLHFKMLLCCIVSSVVSKFICFLYGNFRNFTFFFFLNVKCNQLKVKDVSWYRVFLICPVRELFHCEIFHLSLVLEHLF